MKTFWESDLEVVVVLVAEGVVVLHLQGVRSCVLITLIKCLKGHMSHFRYSIVKYLIIQCE